MNRDSCGSSGGHLVCVCKTHHYLTVHASNASLIYHKWSRLLAVQGFHFYKSIVWVTM